VVIRVVFEEFPIVKVMCDMIDLGYGELRGSHTPCYLQIEHARTNHVTKVHTSCDTQTSAAISANSRHKTEGRRQQTLHREQQTTGSRHLAAGSWDQSIRGQHQVDSRHKTAYRPHQ
jgi:hypothetical protein